MGRRAQCCRILVEFVGWLPQCPRPVIHNACPVDLPLPLARELPHLVTSVEGGGPPSGADLNGPVSLTAYITMRHRLFPQNWIIALHPSAPKLCTTSLGHLGSSPNISLSVTLLFMEVKELRFKQTSTQTLASPLASCVKCSKLLNLSKCLCPPL